MTARPGSIRMVGRALWAEMSYARWWVLGGLGIAVLVAAIVTVVFSAVRVAP